MKISVFSIQKSDEFKTEISQYIKMSKFSAEVVENVMTKSPKRNQKATQMP